MTAVKITTRAFAELQRKPFIGRAEAVRMAMRTLVKTGTPAEAQPSQWAPFVVVGERADEFCCCCCCCGMAAPPEWRWLQ